MIINPDHLRTHLKRYLRWLETTHHSPRTIQNRKGTLTRFIDWCVERGLDKPTEITLPVIERYQRYLYHFRKPNGQPLSVNVQHNYLSHVKGFFRYLTKERYLLYNPAADIDMPRKQKRLPRTVLTPYEIETVLNQPDISEPLGIRDRAMLETLYSTGMRRMELINLSIYDLNSLQKTVLIREGKGKRDRVVPIGERALLWIQKYLEQVRPEFIIDPNDTLLFLSQNGQIMKTSWLTRLAERYIQQAYPDKRGACHVFRHSMATHMLANGADIRYIQLILGHQQLETTQIYTHVSINQLIDVHTATHPAKLKNSKTKPDTTALLDDMITTDQIH